MTHDDARADLYISVDVETDGPIPGEYSMLSFGLAVAGTFDAGGFHPHDPGSATFYRELKPISEKWTPDALKISGLDRDRLRINGEDPAVAMTAAAKWVRDVATDAQPVLVAYPLAFDWMFLQWYFVRYAQGGSPFGYASCLDIQTIQQQKTGSVVDAIDREHLPLELRPTRPHTHNALDDAVEQAELLTKLLAWRP